MVLNACNPINSGGLQFQATRAKLSEKLLKKQKGRGGGGGGKAWIKW
jgi:hypothetical protein